MKQAALQCEHAARASRGQVVPRRRVANAHPFLGGAFLRKATRQEKQDFGPFSLDLSDVNPTGRFSADSRTGVSPGSPHHLRDPVACSHERIKPTETENTRAAKRRR